MSEFIRNPINQNYIHPNKFQIKFSRCPNVQFFAQSIFIPGVSVVEIPRTNPFVELYSPGEKTIYDVLNITFIVDEELTSWIEIHDWIRAMTFPTNFGEYRNLPHIYKPIQKDIFAQFSDATLTLLSASNNALFNFKFIDIFPIALSTVPLSSKSSPDEIITCDATFRYSWYDVEKLF